MDVVPLHQSETFAVVVNDDPVQLGILCKLVHKAGLSAHGFTSAEAALAEMGAAIRQGDDPTRSLPDLVVTDLYMPGIDGWRFCRLLRSQEYEALNAIPILVVSAIFAGDETGRIAVDLGAEAFIPSPVDGRQFVEQVRAIIEGRQLQHPLRVLLAETDASLAAILRRSFANHHCTVETVETIRDGEAAISKAAYEIAVLDYDLPDGKGDGLLDTLRAVQPDCVCIMTTSNPQPELALDWMKRGAAAYLRKPFEPDYLLELCDRARSERTLLRVQDQLDIRTQELRESEEKFRLIAENTSDGILVISSDYKILYASPSYARQLGYSLEEEVDRDSESIYAMIHPEDREPLFRSIFAAIETKQPGLQYTYRVQHKAGHYIWREDLAKFLYDNEGNHAKTYVICRDITQSKEAEEALARNSAEIKAIYDSTPTMMCIMTGDRTVLHANPAFTEFTGIEEGEFVGGRACGIFGCINAMEDPRGCGFSRHCGDCRLRLSLEDSLATGTRHQNIEHQATWIRDGEPRDLVILASTARIEMPDAPSLLLCMHDITNQKLAEEAVRESERRFRHLADTVPVLIWMSGTDRGCTYFNRVWLEFTGRTLLQEMGSGWTEGVHPDDLRCCVDVYNSHFDMRREFLMEYRLRRANGEYRWVRDNGVPRFDGASNFIGYIGSCVDVTESKLAHETLTAQADFNQRVFNSTDAHLAVIDEDGTILDVNMAWRAYAQGHKPETEDAWGVGANYFVEYDPSWGDTTSARETFEGIRAVQRGELPFFSLEYPCHAPDGRKSWFVLHAHPLQGRKGSALVWHTDVTDIKVAQYALKKSEEKYSQLIETSKEGIWIADKNFATTFVNTRLTEMFGYTQEEMLGKPVAFFLFDEDVEHQSQQIEQRMRGESEVYERRYRKKDGQPVWTITSASPLMSETGQFQGGFAMITDITLRKKAEDELRQFKTIFDTASFGAVISTLDGGLTYANSCFSNAHGYKPEELIGKSIKNLHTEEQFPHVERLLQQILSTGYMRPQEVWHLHRDGHTFPMMSTGNLVQDENGIPKYLASTALDITEHKRAEEELRALKLKVGEREIYSVLVESASDGFWLLDRDFNTIYVNPAITDMLGYSREEMIGRSWYEFGDPDWVARAKELEKRRETGVQESHTFLFVHKNGRKILTRLATTPLFETDGTFNGALGILSDITRQKEAEDALQIKDILNTIAQNSSIGMCLINPDFTVAWYNDLYGQWFGPLEGTKGRNCFEVFEGKAEICPGCPARVTFDTGKVVSSERIGVTTLAGPGRTVIVTTSPILDPNGHIIQVVEIAQDITTRARAEEERAHLEAQLQHAQKMESVGRLAGGVAHDFNNMLMVILGHAETALSRVEPAQPLHADLLEIIRAGERSADITRQLLAFARKQTIAPKVLDLNEALEGMLNMLRRLIGENIDFAWLPGRNLWPVRVDPSQIDQILANLCVNARDAIAGVGKITIETRNSTLDSTYCASHRGAVPGDYVHISVSDNGCGMNKDTLLHVFEPFFTTKGLGKGTGLGLATVYGAVKQNNGFLNVDSQPDQGTTFTIYLPRHIGMLEHAPAENPEEPARGGLETILLVEDEPAILRLAALSLEAQGYTVLAAATPREAIQLAEECVGNVDLLMTDVILPEMNGRDLAKHLLSLFPMMKRLFMSGYTADVIARHGVLDSGVHFIQKPFSMNTMAAKVHEMLSNDEEKA